MAVCAPALRADGRVHAAWMAVYTPALRADGRVPSAGIAGPHGRSLRLFLRRYRAVFRSGGDRFLPPPAAHEGSSSPHLCHTSRIILKSICALTVLGATCRPDLPSRPTGSCVPSHVPVDLVLFESPRAE